LSNLLKKEEKKCPAGIYILKKKKAVARDIRQGFYSTFKLGGSTSTKRL
jgi:hypothetical protein